MEIKKTAFSSNRFCHHLIQIVIHVIGYGSLIGCSCFLIFTAKRYHSVYAWAHGEGRNISPEQFYQSANFANHSILLVAAAAVFLAVRGKYLPGKFLGYLCTAICILLFLHGCNVVAVRH